MDMKCMSHRTANRTRPNTEKPCRATSSGAMLLRGPGRRGAGRPPRVALAPVGRRPADRPHSGGKRRVCSGRRSGLLPGTGTGTSAGFGAPPGGTLRLRIRWSKRFRVPAHSWFRLFDSQQTDRRSADQLELRLRKLPDGDAVSVFQNKRLHLIIKACLILSWSV